MIFKTDGVRSADRFRSINVIFFAVLGISMLLPLRALEQATDGLVQHHLISSLIVFVAFAIILKRFGKLSLVDIGFDHKQIRGALLFTLVIWLLAQSVHILSALMDSGDLQWHNKWNAGLTRPIVFLLGMFVVGLWEELFFRGFWVPQFYVRFQTRMSASQAAITAVIITQILFGVGHVFSDIGANSINSHTPERFFSTAMHGVFFLGAWLATGNLLIAVGIHALGNAPTTVFASPLSSHGTIMLVSLLVLGFFVIVRLFRADDVEPDTPGPD